MSNLITLRTRNGGSRIERGRRISTCQTWKNHYALEAWERMTTGGVKILGCEGQQMERGFPIRLRWTSALRFTLRRERKRAA